jgi:hypothetical protein
VAGIFPFNGRVLSPAVGQPRVSVLSVLLPGNGYIQSRILWPVLRGRVIADMPSIITDSDEWCRLLLPGIGLVIMMINH